MATRLRTLPVNSLAAARNARTRIFVPGADPKFGRPARSTTFQLIRAFPEKTTAPADAPRLWRPEVVDRLQAPITRYRE